MAFVECSTLPLLALAFSFGAASGAVHTIGFNTAPVWTVGIGVSYTDVSITLGKTLSFLANNMHDVVLVHQPVSGTPWDLCSTTGIPSGSRTTIFAPFDFAATNTEKHYTPPTCGDFFIACSVSAHCAYGQRVKVTVTNVDGSTCASPCAGTNCVTSDSKLAVSASQNVHGVAPALPSPYWGVAFYDDMVVNIGDTVLFKTGAGFHDVATVPYSTAFSTCDMSAKTVVAEWDYASGNTSATCTSSSTCCASSSCGRESMLATYVFTATAAGDVYFVCSVGMHCQSGQKIKITVESAGSANGACQAVVRWSVFLLASFSPLTLRL